jgi:ABC-type dipeptide/oligopeptide/nickel transport system ATPase component
MVNQVLYLVRRYKKYRSYRSLQRKKLKSVLGKTATCIFQEPKSALNPYLSIGSQMLDCIARGRHAGVADRAKFGKDMLVSVGIVDADLVWNNFPHHLSGGMAQRIMIAMALASGPKLLIADEPTTALDVTTQAKLLRLFLKFKKEQQLSVLLISHDIGVVREVADRVYVMYHGEIVESGPAQQVINSPKHDYTKLLLSSFDHLALKH